MRSYFNAEVSRVCRVGHQSALAVAIVNVDIPLLLGDLVNVLSEHTSESCASFMADIKQPVIRLLTMSVIQVTPVNHHLIVCLHACNVSVGCV